MKAKFTDGQTLYATHLIIGTHPLCTGSLVTVIESYSERGAETRYLVRSLARFKVYCYESDLSVADPLSGMHHDCDNRGGACLACRNGEVQS